MATAANQKDMHEDELVISGAPYPISDPSILDQGATQQTIASASPSAAITDIITSSPSSSSSPSPHSSKADVESHLDPVGQTKAHRQQAGAIPVLSNLPGDQSGPSSIINKHHNYCNTAPVISQQQKQEEEALLQPQHPTGNTGSGMSIISVSHTLRSCFLCVSKPFSLGGALSYNCHRFPCLSFVLCIR